MCFSSGFDRTDKIEIGLKFEGFALLIDLCMGMTFVFCFFKAQGKVFSLCISCRHV